MRLALSLAAVAVLLLMARPLKACLWDYDTLAAEAKGQMADVVHIIAGRFERKPPLYYEMRLERLGRADRGRSRRPPRVR